MQKNLPHEICPNTEFFWSVFSRIWTEYGDLLRKSPYSVQIWKIRTRKKPVFGQFSHTDVFKNSVNDKILYYIIIANLTDILLNIFRLCFTSFKTSIFQSDF